MAFAPFIPSAFASTDARVAVVRRLGPVTRRHLESVRGIEAVRSEYRRAGKVDERMERALRETDARLLVNHVRLTSLIAIARDRIRRLIAEGRIRAEDVQETEGLGLGPLVILAVAAGAAAVLAVVLWGTSGWYGTFEAAERDSERNAVWVDIMRQWQGQLSVNPTTPAPPGLPTGPEQGASWSDIFRGAGGLVALTVGGLLLVNFSRKGRR